MSYYCKRIPEGAAMPPEPHFETNIIQKHQYGKYSEKEGGREL